MLDREITQPIDFILGRADLNNPEKELPEYLSDLKSNISEYHEMLEKISVLPRKDNINIMFSLPNKFAVSDVILKLDSAKKRWSEPKTKTSLEWPIYCKGDKIA